MQEDENEHHKDKSGCCDRAAVPYPVFKMTCKALQKLPSCDHRGYTCDDMQSVKKLFHLKFLLDR